MEKVDSIMELLSGYETYSTVEEINLSAASDAPATTLVCAATAGASWLTGQAVSKTYDEGC
ncbi:LxmA leader domain family RiPP [Streptomyces achromogenes]|jgi:hypothetical protein|uniref:LxmA leader domain family RiPP n=1 Tax=Streptomyces achromogenes TaxID=67255 RepID=A0ABZ1KKA6_STRAH|nr:LxmA leader domain family RiPP [Streptomyces achromogenes]MCZ0204761.1 LxmA leader domain family RiPP [Streptomyces sp. UMAF16]